jgi:beta-lactamase regulating signal transducer with metallopeptidase domain
MELVADKSIALFSFLLNTSLKGCCFLLVSILIYSLGKRLGPKPKYIILFLSILSFILVPVFSLLLNTLWGFFAAGSNYEQFYPISFPVIDSLQRGLIEIPSQANLSAFLKANCELPTGINWIGWLLLIWGIGFTTAFIRIVMGKLGLLYINRHSLTAGKKVSNYLQNIKKAMGIKKGVRLIFSDNFFQPATFSWLRPVILLPFKARQWSFRELKPVLIHELAHIKQGDCLIRDIARFVCGLFWFVPFIWVAYNKMKEEQEKACDTKVVNFGLKPVDYAQQLLCLVKDSMVRKLFNYAMIPMIPKKILKSRIEYILKIKDYLQTRFSNKKLLIFSLCSLVLILPLATVNPFAVGSDIEVLAQLKNTLHFEEATDLAILAPEIRNSLRTLPVIWPVLDGDGEVRLGDFIDKEKSLRITLGRWDYGVVIATADGIVRSIENICKNTYRVFIEHKNNLYSIYSPVVMCEKFEIGDKVCQGDILGYFYMDKLAYEIYYGYESFKNNNCYLNFGLLMNSDYIDPLQFIFAFNKKLFIKY